MPICSNGSCTIGTTRPRSTSCALPPSHEARRGADRLRASIGPPNTATEDKFADLNMLVMNGGRERTRDEFADLFGQSGFRLISVTPTATRSLSWKAYGAGVDRRRTALGTERSTSAVQRFRLLTGALLTSDSLACRSQAV